MSDMYTKNVMDHFANPRNVGEIEDADGVGTVGNAKCGDIMQFFIKVEDDRIVDIKFKTFGCGAAIATSSASTETPATLNQLAVIALWCTPTFSAPISIAPASTSVNVKPSVRRVNW